MTEKLLRLIVVHFIVLQISFRIIKSNLIFDSFAFQKIHLQRRVLI